MEPSFLPDPRVTRAWLLVSVAGVGAALAYGSLLTHLTTVWRFGSRAPMAADLLPGALFAAAVLAFVLALRHVKRFDRDAWRERLPILRGPRVCLRELERADSARLLELLTAETRRHLPRAPDTLRAARRFVAHARVSRARGRGCCFAVATTGERRMIGLVQFFALPGRVRRLGWGFLLDRSVWGQGLFTEAASLALPFAFDVVGAGELTAWVAQENDRSHRALARLGATGVLTKAGSVPDGRRGDFVWWTIRRPARVE